MPIICTNTRDIQNCIIITAAVNELYNTHC